MQLVTTVFPLCSLMHQSQLSCACYACATYTIHKLHIAPQGNKYQLQRSYAINGCSPVAPQVGLHLHVLLSGELSGRHALDAHVYCFLCD